MSWRGMRSAPLDAEPRTAHRLARALQRKRVLIGLAPLLAGAALALLPAAAQATEPCWTKNSTLCGSVKESPEVEVYSFGTLTLKTTKGGSGEVTCRVSSAGTVKNKVGGKGEGQTTDLSPVLCEGTTCAGFTEILAESLPWPSLLEEAVPPTIRSKTTGIKVNVLCWASEEAKEKALEGEKPLGSVPFVGSLQPEYINKPSVFPQASLTEFAAGSGELEVEGSGGTVSAQVEGRLETVGYKTQEVIHAIKGP
jgi:hypothetical protein